MPSPDFAMTSVRQGQHRRAFCVRPMRSHRVSCAHINACVLARAVNRACRCTHLLVFCRHSMRAVICAGIIGPRVLRQRKGHGRRSTRRTPHSRASSASRPPALLLECPGSTVMPQPPARQHPSSISPNALQFRRHGPVQLPGGAITRRAADLSAFSSACDA